MILSAMIKTKEKYIDQTKSKNLMFKEGGGG